MSDNRLQDASFPWKGEPDEIACNFAVGDLILNLPQLLKVDDKIHAPTLLAAGGAVAGYAAQQALLSEGPTDPTGLKRSGIHIVETKSGDEFYFGDPLNFRLLARGMEDTAMRLWPLAAGAAVQGGLGVDGVPEFRPMFRHVAEMLGSPDEGYPSLAELRPRIPTKELLKIAWPVARMCFNSELSGRFVKPRVLVSPRWRPVVAAQAAHRFIRDASPVVGARNALIALFESAIYASKLKLPLR